MNGRKKGTGASSIDAHESPTDVEIRLAFGVRREHWPMARMPELVLEHKIEQAGR
jgi:hypothetical protein